MSKSAEAFRTISEVAEVLDTPAHVLRFWESRFSQIRPVKRAGGRRYYRPADVALLGGIKKLLHDDGLTIRGVQKMLREMGVRHVTAIGGGFDEDVAPDGPAVTWPAAPAPEPAPADGRLVHDPEDAEPDLFARAEAAPAPHPVDRPHPDAAHEWFPAAALLRAMTHARAAAQADGLRAVHARLDRLYQRRLSGDR